MWPLRKPTNDDQAWEDWSVSHAPTIEPQAWPGYGERRTPAMLDVHREARAGVGYAQRQRPTTPLNDRPELRLRPRERVFTVRPMRWNVHCKRCNRRMVASDANYVHHYIPVAVDAAHPDGLEHRVHVACDDCAVHIQHQLEIGLPA